MKKLKWNPARFKLSKERSTSPSRDSLLMKSSISKGTVKELLILSNWTQEDTSFASRLNKLIPTLALLSTGSAVIKSTLSLQNYQSMKKKTSFMTQWYRLCINSLTLASTSKKKQKCLQLPTHSKKLAMDSQRSNVQSIALKVLSWRLTPSTFSFIFRILDEEGYRLKGRFKNHSDTLKKFSVKV